MTVALETPHRTPTPPPRPRWRVARAVDTFRDDLRAPAAWPVLDGVRGIAVLAAVAWHVFRMYPAEHVTSASVPVVYWPLGTMRFCVDAFFVLSGFLVVRSWVSVRRSTGIVRGYLSFMGRRAARILPAYWASLAVLVPLVAPVLFDQPLRLVGFLTVNQYVKFWLPERVNPVYWTLTTEWHFYLLVPLVAWLLARFGRWPVLLGCVALSAWWYLSPPWRLPAGFVFGRLEQFVAGAVLGQLVAAHARGAASRLVELVQRRHAGTVIVGALLALGTYHGSTFGMGGRDLPSALLHPAVAVLIAAGLLRLLTGGTSRLLMRPAARFFGTISFGLYLWHYPILDHGEVLRDLPVPLPSFVWTTVVVAGLVAASVAAAALSYVLIERPFIRRKPTSRDTAEHRTGPSSPAGTLARWPSRRSSASRPSTASRSAARRIPIPSSRRRC